jgi:DNA polymerase/3'-5' exonuclease PolX
MSDIRNVYGIGSKKANDLRKHYNIRTISSLRKYVRKIPEIVNEAQRTGLKYHDKIVKPIKYDEATKHIKFIVKCIPTAIIAGSYRRQSKYINDIDVLVTDLTAAINTLISKKYIIATLLSGDEKFSGIVKLPNTTSYRKIDIIRTSKELMPFALLYFTGDFVQNIAMRQKAKKMKYSLSQYGLKDINDKMVKNIKSEEDIFKFLNMTYKRPEDRTHTGKEKEVLSKLK